MLENAELFWVTTVRPDGRPHSTPLVAVWLDDALHFCTGETEQKAHNLATNPNVLLTTGDNGWKGGLDVVVEGAAVRVTDDALLGRLAEAWREKWDGQWQFEARDGAFHHGDGGRGARLPGRAHEGARVRQGHVHPHAPPVRARLTRLVSSAGNPLYIGGSRRASARRWSEPRTGRTRPDQQRSRRAAGPSR